MFNSQLASSLIPCIIFLVCVMLYTYNIRYKEPFVNSFFPPTLSLVVIVIFDRFSIQLSSISLIFSFSTLIHSTIVNYAKYNIRFQNRYRFSAITFMQRHKHARFSIRLLPLCDFFNFFISVLLFFLFFSISRSFSLSSITNSKTKRISSIVNTFP